MVCWRCRSERTVGGKVLEKKILDGTAFFTAFPSGVGIVCDDLLHGKEKLSNGNHILEELCVQASLHPFPET